MPNIPEIKIGNTTYKLKDGELRQDIILAKSTQPTEECNKIWVNEAAATEHQVPIYTEHQAVLTSVSKPLTWTDGYYLSGSGTTISHTLFSVSDYVDISCYETVTVKSYIVDAASICLYDESKTFLRAFTNPTRTLPYSLTFSMRDYPKAYYIRLCTLTANKNEIILAPNVSMRSGLHVIPNTDYAGMPAQYRDCNNLPMNTVIGFKFGWTEAIAPTMLHFPVSPFYGDIITINSSYAANGSSTDWGSQIALYTDNTGKKRMYYRTRYLGWSNWKAIDDEDKTDRIVVYDNVTYSNLPVEFRDCDTHPVNMAVGFHFGWTEEITPTMLHFPVVPFTGTILTMNSVKGNQTFGVQLAFEEGQNSQRMWYRTRYVNYSAWKQVADTSMIPSGSVRSSGAYRGLGDFVLCGDSLSVSISYKAQASAKTVKSWGKILADMMSTECDVYAQGGITTGGFLSSNLYTQAVANESQFAILYLGTNDANQSVSKETFKSNYQSIINGLLTNHQFVFCVNLPECTSASTRGTYNEGIAEICAANNRAFMVDVAQYNSYFAPFKNWGHLSSVGYAAFAEAASWAIDDTMLANDYFDADIDFPELMGQ